MGKFLLVFLGISILISLGNWQIKRADFKEYKIKLIEERKNIPPVKFSQIENTENFEELIYKKFLLKGEFLPQFDIFLYGNSKGKQGFYLFRPFSINQKIFMVNLGFVTNKEEKIQSPENFEAILLLPVKANYFTPKNDLKNNMWFSVNLEEMEKFIGHDIQKAYFTLDKKSISPIFNDHMRYAITWYLLALILFIIYILYSRLFSKLYSCR